MEAMTVSSTSAAPTGARASATGRHQKSYQRMISARVRTANVAALGRAGAIQVVWLVILIASSAIPLSEALITEGWGWLSPVLAFVVVVAAGFERVFGKTTEAAVATDELRRGLARERRVFRAGSNEYASSPDPFGLFVDRCEALIGNYDRRMSAHAAQIVDGASPVSVAS